MRFVVVLLIGSGWSLLKPYLNDKEKRIVLVVLALQVYSCLRFDCFYFWAYMYASITQINTPHPPPPPSTKTNDQTN